MDDLWARIQAQNEEMDRMNEEKARVIQLGKAEASLAAHEAYVQNPRAHQQQQWEQPQQNQHGGEHQQLSAAAIAAQERELDRQLELERSLARGAAQDPHHRVRLSFVFDFVHGRREPLEELLQGDIVPGTTTVPFPLSAERLERGR